MLFASNQLVEASEKIEVNNVESKIEERNLDKPDDADDDDCRLW
jgi:hypothetical protein